MPKNKKSVTLVEALEDIAEGVKSSNNDKNVASVIVFVINEECNSCSFIYEGKPIHTINFLNYIKDKYIDEVVGRIIKENKIDEAYKALYGEDMANDTKEVS